MTQQTMLRTDIGNHPIHNGGSVMTDKKIRDFADRLTKLADAYKADRAALLAKAKNANIEPAALQRLVAWMRKDELVRLEQEAVDDQYRFLAGMLPAPAHLPKKGELATAAALYNDGLPTRAVAKKMGISLGKAHKLKVKAAAFNVQPHVNMNNEPEPASPPAARTTGEADTGMETSMPVATVN
jgi:hypothetical protein